MTQTIDHDKTLGQLHCASLLTALENEARTGYVAAYGTRRVTTPLGGPQRRALYVQYSIDASERELYSYSVSRLDRGLLGLLREDALAELAILSGETTAAERDAEYAAREAARVADLAARIKGDALRSGPPDIGAGASRKKLAAISAARRRG